MVPYNVVTVPAHSLYSFFTLASPTIVIVRMIRNTTPNTLLEYLQNHITEAITMHKTLGEKRFVISLTTPLIVFQVNAISLHMTLILTAFVDTLLLSVQDMEQIYM